MERNIRWTQAAIRQLRAAVEYIQKDSLQNAEKVRVLILLKIEALKKHNSVHHQDSLKKNNDGSFFYFEIVRYRIAYRVVEDEVLIVRIRHTAQEPKIY